MSELAVAAPGKLNLCLHVGGVREDGLHQLVSLFESVTLADTLFVRPTDGLHDRVICPGIEGENLVERTLRSAREAGLLNGPPLAVTIEKRVPVAAGMGGGSGDAAAALRLVATLENRPLADYEQLAFQLGADVPSQLTPGARLVFGAGERVLAVAPESLAAAAERAYVIVEQQQGLSTADVFRQADRSELTEPEVVGREEELIEQVSTGLDTAALARLVANTLTPAIVALRPELSRLPEQILKLGALAADFTGSGPTSFGLFESLAAAEQAAAALAADGHRVHTAVPVTEEFCVPVIEEAS